MGTPVPSHFWLVLGILLNGLLYTIRNVWVHILCTGPVGVEPANMVSRWVGATLTIQWGVDLTCCLSDGIFGHNHTNRRGLLVGIIWVNQNDKWRLFLIRSARSISIIKFSFWGHEYHWRMLPCLFISWFSRSERTFLQCFKNHRVVFLRLKVTSQASHFYWGFYPYHDQECPRMMASPCWLHCRYIFSGILIWFQFQIYDQKEPLVSQVFGVSSQPWGNLDPSWYQ